MKKLLFLLFAICAALPQDAVCSGSDLNTSTNPDKDTESTTDIATDIQEMTTSAQTPNEEQSEEQAQQQQQSAPVTPDPEKVQQAKDAEQAYQDARNIEKAGRPLTALSTAMTGAGGYMIASSISEKIADKNAEKAMNEYIGNMYCNYGGGQQVDLGDTEIIPDGDELFNYYQEYVNTANRLKSTKAALNLTPGIESQVVYTDAKYNLYNYQPAGARSTGEISLARALMDANSADATAWAEQKEKTNTMLGLGTTLAVGGIGTGLANRAYTNKYREQHQRLKEETQAAVDELIKTETALELKVQNSTEQNTNLTEQVTTLTTDLTNTQKDSFNTELATISFSADRGYFGLNTTLTQPLTSLLDTYANKLQTLLNKSDFQKAKVKISVIGHTDHVPLKTGSRYSNLNAFSKARAEAVTKYLSDKLTEFDARITYESIGEGSSKCPQTPKNNENCRKVEITLTDITSWDTEAE